MPSPEAQPAFSSVMGAVIGAVVVIVGWFISHHFATTRDQRNKRRELRAVHLIGAYRELSRAGIDRSLRNRAKDFENAISEIHLFGTREQIRLAQACTEELSASGSVDLMPLMLNLRSDLRRELNVEREGEKISLLRLDGQAPSEEDALLNVLVGQLFHVLEHYAYAAFELRDSTLPSETEIDRLRLRLTWSKFGGLAAVDALDRYGFLPREAISLLLQLAFRIRNCDAVVSRLTERQFAPSDSDLTFTEERMRYVVASTDLLLDEVVAIKPQFATAVKELRARLDRDTQQTGDN